MTLLARRAAVASARRQTGYVFPPTGAYFSETWDNGDATTFDDAWDAVGGFSHSGTGSHSRETGITFNGSVASCLLHQTSSATVNGSRVHLFNSLLGGWREFYASMWQYFPHQYTVANWWQNSQLKSKDPNVNPDTGTADGVHPTWALRVENRAGSGLMFYRMEYNGQYYGETANQSFDYGGPEADVNIPVGVWFNVEWFIRKSTDGSTADGRIMVWVDGVLCWDFDNVKNVFDPYPGDTWGNTRWGPTNYGNNIHVLGDTNDKSIDIYCDNVAIAPTRVWTSTGGGP